MWISIKAIGLGLLLYLGGFMAAVVLMGILASILIPAYLQPEHVPDSEIPILFLMLELGFVFLGSFVAGKIAKKAHVTHGLIIGVIGLLLGLFLKSGNPVWFKAISSILILPMGAWGASVAKGRP